MIYVTLARSSVRQPRPTTGAFAGGVRVSARRDERAGGLGQGGPAAASSGEMRGVLETGAERDARDTVSGLTRVGKQLSGPVETLLQDPAERRGVPGRNSR